MKKITVVLFLLLSILALGQDATIQIRLLDAEVGEPIGCPDCDPIYAPESNDAGLNAIFVDYGAYRYEPSDSSHPYIPYRGRNNFVSCIDCDMVGFRDALNAYSSVVEKARISPEPVSFADVLEMYLVDSTVGSDTGTTTSTGIIITNNDALNAIFVTHNVIGYGSSSSSNYTRVGCDCNVVDLKPDLDNLTAVVLETSYTGYVILGIADFNGLDLKLFPNPMTDQLSIETTAEIETIRLFNALGQMIVQTRTVAALNMEIPNLRSGMYVLQVTTNDQQRASYRLLKQ